MRLSARFSISVYLFHLQFLLVTVMFSHEERFFVDESGRGSDQAPRHPRGSRAIALQNNVRPATDPKSDGLSTTVDSHALESSRQRRPFRCCASAPWRAIAGCVVPNTALAPLGYAGHGQYSTNCAPAPGYGMEFRWTSRSFRATRAHAATLRFGCRTGTRPRQWRRTSIPAVTKWTIVLLSVHSQS